MENRIKNLRNGFRTLVERAAGGETPPKLYRNDKVFAALVEEEMTGKPLKIQPTLHLLENLRRSGAI